MDPQHLQKLEAARDAVDEARRGTDKFALVEALKRLADIERRIPELRSDSNETYTKRAELSHELGLPLEAAWAIRHIGINLEYAGELEKAEERYDESLAIFRQHAAEDEPNYANTVRYPAVIKNRLGKRAESERLWLEAYDRYSKMHLPVAVAEACAWLTIFAVEAGDLPSAHRWFAEAESAAVAAKDPDTDKFISEVREKLSTT